ncbi:MAG: TetR/AcrR family transcriptional regulator [Dehalococcoidia bacterium]|jgi:AcrR family transcriptional regulator|nr:TetR/AcrR family transcriptional regulator [Dehalococcoidia bacterium]|tara:strand:- start:50 stop:694 length:645 start_codon:yes stop_codon:yes gene_type:complete
MATRTRLDHQTRQHQIVEAARELIATGGVDSLTIRGLASRVGVTEAAIYRHVASKEEVMLLLLQEVQESLFQAISRATRSDRHALERLEHMLQLHVSYVELRQGISFVVIAQAAQFEEPRVRSAGRRLVEKYLSLVSEIITQGIERGEIDKTVSPDAAAMIFFGMIQSAVTRWLFDPSTHPLSENAVAMWVLFRTSLEFSDEDADRHLKEEGSD